MMSTRVYARINTLAELISQHIFSSSHHLHVSNNGRETCDFIPSTKNNKPCKEMRKTCGFIKGNATIKTSCYCSQINTSRIRVSVNTPIHILYKHLFELRTRRVVLIS
jgi:hypothetical protein